MLLEDVENLEFSYAQNSYKRCLNMLRSAELFDNGEGDSPFRVNIESAGQINLENFNVELSPGPPDKISGSLSKEGEDGEEE